MVVKVAHFSCTTKIIKKTYDRVWRTITRETDGERSELVGFRIAIDLSSVDIPE